MLVRATDISAQRPGGSTEDVHFTEAMASAVIEEAMAAGDLVLDPFAGTGRRSSLAELLRVGGHAVVNRANLFTGDVVTTLAWDVGRVVSEHLAFRGETFPCWDQHPPGPAGDYLLWFRRT